MNCSVSFSFHSNRKPMKRKFVYAAEHVSVKRGDIVEVDYQGIPYLAGVHHVFEQDLHNFLNLKRKPINKKLHTNTVKAAVRKRFNQYKEIYVNTRKKKGRKLERKLFHQFGEDYHRQILKYVCLGNIIFETPDSIFFLYADHLVLLKKDPNKPPCLLAVQTVENYYKPWLTPDKLKAYVDQLYDEQIKNEASLI